ncbi:MAG: glucose 1-dehydrogenase [Betaproteobacteria bacterium]|nr:MAG: glucose 1-dehydrogenase [Betaproteobacteria bacterium]
MSEKEFQGKTALVTGGSRGIGRATCLALAREGARVAVNYVSNEKAAGKVVAEIKQLGGEAMVVGADVSDSGSVTNMVATVEHGLGPVDLLVTSAGIAKAAHHSEMTFESWRQMMSINVDGTYLPVMAVKDGMLDRGYGRIVCIASIAGLRPRGRMITYSTSKAAVIAFARSCSEAFGPAIRVNSVAPGLIETEMGAQMGPEGMQRMADEAFLKRIGQPEEIAETVLFLLSERSSFTTGQTLVADGGRVTLP